MQKFDYRAPRFSVDFPVHLRWQDSHQLVRCVDISANGMRIELHEPPQPCSCGRVSFCFQDLSLELPVWITYANANSTGLKFLYESDEQRSLVLELLSRLVSTPPDTALFLVSCKPVSLVHRDLVLL